MIPIIFSPTASTNISHTQRSWNALEPVPFWLQTLDNSRGAFQRCPKFKWLQECFEVCKCSLHGVLVATTSIFSFDAKSNSGFYKFNGLIPIRSFSSKASAFLKFQTVHMIAKGMHSLIILLPVFSNYSTRWVSLPLFLVWPIEHPTTIKFSPILPRLHHNAVKGDPLFPDLNHRIYS